MRTKLRRRTRQPRNDVKYTFHSYGTHFSFNPYWIVEDDRSPNETGWFDKTTLLNMYRKEVRMANAPHVYILDEKGQVVK